MASRVCPYPDERENRGEIDEGRYVEKTDRGWTAGGLGTADGTDQADNAEYKQRQGRQPVSRRELHQPCEARRRDAAAGGGRQHLGGTARQRVRRRQVAELQHHEQS